MTTSTNAMRSPPARRALAEAVALALASMATLASPAWAQSNNDGAGEKPKEERPQAQDKPTAPTAKATDTAAQTITVTGSRRQAETFVRDKREATRVVDAIGEAEAGKLPVQNAAELVSMLPSVMSYSDRTASENLTSTQGRYASVRGIRPDLNITTLDGLNLAVPNQSGRANFLDWFPVNLAKRVEVIKTFTPEDDLSAIGGQINLVTRSGFDYPQGLFLLDASLRRDELQTALRPISQPFEASLVMARKLSSELAITASASLNRRHEVVSSRENVARVAFNADGSRATFFPAFNNFIGPVPGNGIAVPLINRLYASDTLTDRVSFGTRLDWRPSAEMAAWVTLGYTKADQDHRQSYSDVRQPFLCFPFFGCVNRAESQTGNTGTIRVAFNDAAFTEAQTSRNKSDLGFMQLGAHRFVGDAIKLELRSSLSQARQNQEDYFSFFGQDKRDILFDYDLSNPLSPTYRVRDADNVFDPNTYKLRRVDHIPLSLKEKVSDTILSAAFNSEPEDTGWGGKVGLRFKTSDRSYREKFISYAPVDGSPTITAASLLSNVNPFSVGIPGVSADSRPVLVDPARRNAELLPKTGDPLLFTPNLVSDLGNDYDLNEKTASAFLQAQYRKGPLFVVGGLTQQRTTLKGDGYRQTDGGPFEPIRTENTQSVLLPSIVANYDATRELKLRLGLSKTIGRPGYDALAPRGESLTLNNELGTATLVKSNPDLRPRKATNLDLAAEYYFDGGRSLLSVGYFDKKIKDEIFVGSELVPMTFNGTTYATTISQAQNASSATLKGVELNASKSLDFLPMPFNRLGVQGNASFISGDFALQRPRLDGNGTQTPGFLPNQPTRIYNLSVFYAGPALDVNLSVNRTGSFIVGFFADAPQNDIWHVGRTLVNAKASYKLNDKLRFYVAGNNLTSKDLYEVSGPPELNNLRRVYRSGATVTMGLSYSLGS